MAGNTFKVWIALGKHLKDCLLLPKIWLKGNLILDVSFFMIALIYPQVVRLNPEQNIHIRQTVSAEISGFLP